MNNFIISADSTCDLNKQEKEAFKVHVAVMKFIIDQSGTIDECDDNFQDQKEYNEFYERLHKGAIARTSMLTEEAHKEHFEKLVKQGNKNILHFSISSGLTPTVEKAKLASEQVMKENADVKILVIDTLSATLGVRGLLEIAIEMRDSGKGLQETYDFVMDLRTKVQHFICVDDLFFLNRGGRLSKVAAMAGTLLNLKPMVSFNNEGKLEVIEKNKGMKKTFSSIMAKIEKMPVDKENFHMYIVHCNNEERAKELALLVKEIYGYEVPIHIMGPVIGSHVGPGGVALTYLSTCKRNEF